MLIALHHSIVIHKKHNELKSLPPEGHAGEMRMKDGTVKNYGAIRYENDETVLVHFTGKGLRAMYKPGMNEIEQRRADELKRSDESEQIKSGHIEKTLISEVLQFN